MSLRGRLGDRGNLGGGVFLEIASSPGSSQRRKEGVIVSPSVEGRGNPGGGVFLEIASSLTLVPLLRDCFVAHTPRNDEKGVSWRASFSLSLRVEALNRSPE